MAGELWSGDLWSGDLWIKELWLGESWSVETWLGDRGGRSGSDRVFQIFGYFGIEV